MQEPKPDKTLLIATLVGGGILAALLLRGKK